MLLLKSHHLTSLSLTPWGDCLRVARCDARKTIEDAALALKIQPGYIVALEAMRICDLPGVVYARHFFIRYARWLDLSERELILQFEASLVRELSPQVLPIKRVSRGDLRVWTRIAHWSLVAIGSLVVIVYFGFNVYQMRVPPHLSVLSPTGDVQLEDFSLWVAGKTAPEARVVVNGERVQTDSQGFFEKMVPLSGGVNIISVSARTKFSREAAVVRHVIVDPRGSVSLQNSETAQQPKQQS